MKSMFLRTCWKRGAFLKKTRPNDYGFGFPGSGRSRMKFRFFPRLGFALSGRKYLCQCTVRFILLITVCFTGLSAFCSDLSSPPPEKVIIDTDIGDDIDDAFPNALALRIPELQILGSTTTFGDTETRARLLDRFLGEVGRQDIIVAAGTPTRTDNLMTQRRYG